MATFVGDIAKKGVEKTQEGVRFVGETAQKGIGFVGETAQKGIGFVGNYQGGCDFKDSCFRLVIAVIVILIVLLIIRAVVMSLKDGKSQESESMDPTRLEKKLWGEPMEPSRLESKLWGVDKK